MPSSSALFIHALARFRSSLALDTVLSWNERHGYDMAIALRHCLWRLDGKLPSFGLIKRVHSQAIVHVCILDEAEAIDLMGTNALARMTEQSFDEDGELTIEPLGSIDELNAALDQANYFESYWNADVELVHAIQTGISRAAEDFA